MASVTTIREAMATALDTITELRAFATIPDSIAPPAAIVGGPEVIDWRFAFRSTKRRYTIPVRVYVGRASDRASQEKLDAYLASDGAFSIIAALESDSTLGGAVDSLSVMQARGYGVYQIAGVDYLGVEFVVDVIA
jgi:hypothetical protein